MEKHRHHYVTTNQETKVDPKNPKKLIHYQFQKCDNKIGQCDRRDKMLISRTRNPNYKPKG